MYSQSLISEHTLDRRVYLKIGECHVRLFKTQELYCDCVGWYLQSCVHSYFITYVCIYSDVSILVRLCTFSCDLVFDVQVGYHPEVYNSFCSSCRNLFKQQKLLSVGLEPALPIMPHADGEELSDLQPPGFREMSKGPAANWEMMGSNGRLYDTTPVFPTIAFLGMALVLVFLINHFYKGKHKPRRKRMRLKKVVPFGAKVPSVWDCCVGVEPAQFPKGPGITEVFHKWQVLCPVSHFQCFASYVTICLSCNVSCRCMRLVPLQWKSRTVSGLCQRSPTDGAGLPDLFLTPVWSDGWIFVGLGWSLHLEMLPLWW